MVWSSKYIYIERRGYHQSQVDPCLFYRKDSFILTYIDDCVIVSHKQETIISLLEWLNNCPEQYVLTEKRDISNYLIVDMKNNSNGGFELSQSHLV